MSVNITWKTELVDLVHSLISYGANEDEILCLSPKMFPLFCDEICAVRLKHKYSQAEVLGEDIHTQRVILDGIELI